MKTLTRGFALTMAICVLALLIPSVASAEQLCLKSRLKNGKVVHALKSVPDGTACPKRTVAIITPENIASLGGQGVQGPQGPTGPKGEMGLQGLQGPIGPQGAPALAGISIASQLSDSNSTSPKSATAECPVGTTVIGGSGGVIEGIGVPTSLPVAISFAAPLLFSSSQFQVRGFETTATTSNWQVIAFALCIAQ